MDLKDYINSMGNFEITPPELNLMIKDIRNSALDEAANVAYGKRLEAARVYGDGGHASAKYCSYIAESIKELKDER
jgi:hypothetical protein